MPSTYQLISSTVLTTSSAGTVAFNSIPQTYTDLLFKISSRSSVTGGIADTGYFFNGTGFSNTQLLANNTTATSTRTTGSEANGGGVWSNRTNSSANTFSSCEVYWPNYTSTVSQPYRVFTVVENNSETDNAILITAQLWQSTSALTGVTLFVGGGAFLAGSSFYLYGISKS